MAHCNNTVDRPKLLYDKKLYKKANKGGQCSICRQTSKDILQAWDESGWFRGDDEILDTVCKTCFKTATGAYTPKKEVHNG